MKTTSTGVVVTLLAAALGGCSGGVSGSAPHAPSAENVQILRSIHRTPSEQLRALRPSRLPSGTRIYRPRMALLQAPGETALLPIGDVLSVSGGTVTVRMDGQRRVFSAATVTYTDQMQETIVKPGDGVSPDLQALKPAETIP